MSKDLIFSQPKSKIDDFAFDSDVVAVFPDMISRSVPGYATVIDNIGALAQQYVQPDSIVYDLGCSLGEATLAIRRAAQSVAFKIIAVDSAEPMVDGCRKHVQSFRSPVDVEVRQQDIRDTSIENASLVVLNFTLQFLAPDDRQALLNKIYQGLNPGGVLVLSEKIRHSSQWGNEVLIDLHHRFKRQNGYSELEIAQKRTALENVMRTDTLSAHNERLKEAGFNDAVVWFQSFNFCSLVARKV